MKSVTACHLPSPFIFLPLPHHTLKLYFTSVVSFLVFSATLSYKQGKVYYVEVRRLKLRMK